MTTESNPTAVPFWSMVLRALRKARGVTQEGWAAQLGVSRRTVQRWEQGLLRPDPVMEEAILDYCQERGLFRRYDLGPLSGVTLTPEWLRDRLTEARLMAATRGDKAERSLRALGGPVATSPFDDLPNPRTSFIGREQELTDIIRLLDATRLVTLTGPGGVGKTRLAVTAAATKRADFPDDVHFVDLAPVSEPALVISAVGHALGIQNSGDVSLTDAVMTSVRSKRLLLVLDNFEQVREAAPQVNALLGAAPGLTCLVTSRAVLRISGEQEFPVSPLATPSAMTNRDPAMLGDVPAVALFVDRARSVRPEFSLTRDNAAAVAEICARLDGLPLAIELAAARTKLFTPQALLARLDNLLPLLTGGSRDHPTRQQTLQNTIAWSYALLAPAERRVFRQLAVFVGGCTLQAAEAVTGTESGPESSVLDTVTALLDQSLIQQREAPGGEPRIAMLATIQEYAREQLRTSDELEDTCLRHRDWFMHWVRTVGDDVDRDGSRAAIARLEADHDNLYAALQWSLEQHDAEAALRLAVSLWPYWLAQGHAAEAAAWLERALAQPGSVRSRLRARALWQAGWLAKHSDPVRAHRYLEEGLTLYREVGDQSGTAMTLRIIGDLTHERGDVTAARRAYIESLALHRAAGDRSGTAQSLGRLGHLAREAGSFRRAQVLYNAAAALQRAAGDRTGMAWSIHHLADLAFDRGDLSAAHRHYEESLRIFREVGDRPSVSDSLHHLAETSLARGTMQEATASLREALDLDRSMEDWGGVGGCLIGFAGVAEAHGDADHAARLLGAAAALHERECAAPNPVHTPRRARSLAALQEILGDDAFSATYARGRALSLDAAIRLALDRPR